MAQECAHGFAAVHRGFLHFLSGHPIPVGSWRSYASSDDTRVPEDSIRHVNSCSNDLSASGVPPSSHVTPGADGNHLRSTPPGRSGGRAAVCSWATGEGQHSGLQPFSGAAAL